MLSALLISDIHFRTNERLGGPDLDIELRRSLLQFIPELRDRLPGISLVLVCGDVAYHAVGHEYALATEFLREVKAALRDARVLVIPGNHDIDREITKMADQRTWRSSVRSESLSSAKRDARLMKLLNDPDAGPGLFAPLAAYNKFAADYGCDVSVNDPDPYWSASVPIDDRYQAEIRGMTSVLISDAHDNAAEDGLVLGDFQSNLPPSGSAGVVSVTLCHHPYTWLLDGKEQKKRLRKRSALHITGHDHEHGIVVDGGSVHLRAGAFQPTRDDARWAPRLYGLAIGVNETDDSCSGSVEIVSAIWSPDEDKFVIDIEETQQIRVIRAEDAPPVETPDPEIVRLTERLSALQSSDLLDVAEAIEADLGALTAGLEHEIPERLMQHALGEHLLSQLWVVTEERHGGQRSRPNPFEEVR